MRPHRVRLTHSLVQSYGLGSQMLQCNPTWHNQDDISQFHSDGECADMTRSQAAFASLLQDYSIMYWESVSGWCSQVALLDCSCPQVLAILLGNLHTCLLPCLLRSSSDSIQTCFSKPSKALQRVMHCFDSMCTLTEHCISVPPAISHCQRGKLVWCCHVIHITPVVLHNAKQQIPNHGRLLAS